MTRIALGATLVLSTLFFSGSVKSQPAVVWPDPPKVVWPDPPRAQSAAPPSARASRGRRAVEPEEESLPEAAALPASAPPRAAAPRARRASVSRPEIDPDDSVGSTPPTPTRPKPAVAAPLNIRCDGPFARDTSHAQLVRAFGAKNVTFQDIDSAGTKIKATVLFANDKKRRVEIIWRDPAGRKNPEQISISGESGWRARGFKLGETLASVEKTNGKAFRLGGFGNSEYRGAARDWDDGKLEKLSGGCRLGMRFAVGAQTSSAARGKIGGAGDFMSDNPDVRAAEPVISELVIDYPN